MWLCSNKTLFTETGNWPDMGHSFLILGVNTKFLYFHTTYPFWVTMVFPILVSETQVGEAVIILNIDWCCCVRGMEKA